ncbi:hypothetical protein ACEUAZ_01490 [Aeromonas veronii]
MNSRQRRKRAAAEHQLKREEHQRKLEAMRKEPPRNFRTSLVMCAMVAALSSAPAVDISEPQWKQKKRREQPSW